MSARPCPTCAGETNHGVLGALSLDLCLACAGAWFDFGELQSLIQAGPDVVRRLGAHLFRSRGAPTGQRFPHCPTCAIPLSTVRFPSMPDLPLDTCIACRGFWLTGGQLFEVASRLDAALGKPVARAEPRSPEVPARSSESHSHEAAAEPEADVPRSYFQLPHDPDAEAPWNAPPPVSTPASPAPKAAPESAPADSKAPAEKSPARKPPPVIPGRREGWYAAGDPEQDGPDLRFAGGASAGACPRCSERNASEALVCWACGEVLQGMLTGACPRCGGGLRGMNSITVRLSVCDGCGGTWLARERIGALLIQSPEARSNLSERIRRATPRGPFRGAEELICPECRLLMFMAPIMASPEPIAQCPSCEANFLDRGLLIRLLQE